MKDFENKNEIEVLPNEKVEAAVEGLGKYISTKSLRGTTLNAWIPAIHKEEFEISTDLKPLIASSSIVDSPEAEEELAAIRAFDRAKASGEKPVSFCAGENRGCSPAPFGVAKRPKHKKTHWA